MTRTKKRRRLRTIALVIVVLAVGWVGKEIYRVATAVPAPVVDYLAKYAEHRAALQPAGEDGWGHLEAAAATFITVSDGVKDALPDPAAPPISVEFGDRLTTGCPPETRDAVDRGLDLLAETDFADHLDRLAASPRALRPIPPAETLLMVNMPRVIHYIQVGRARAAAMRVAVEAGDVDEATRAFEHALAVSRATGTQGTLLEWMIGGTIAQVALNELRRALVEHPAVFDREACEHLQSIIDRQFMLPACAYWIESERLYFLDAVQYTFTDDGHGDGRVDTARLGTLSIGGAGQGGAANAVFGPIASWFMAGRRDTLAHGNAFYDELVAASELCGADRAASSFDAQTFVDGISRRYVLLRIMCSPALGTAIGRTDTFTVTAEGVRVMLALRAFAADHDGEYPASLDELAPAYLDAVPFDPLRKQPFVYRRLDSGDPPYALYSTGLDGTDDGGKPLPENRRNEPLVGAGGAGFDFVLSHVDDGDGS